MLPWALVRSLSLKSSSSMLVFASNPSSSEAASYLLTRSSDLSLVVPSSSKSRFYPVARLQPWMVNVTSVLFYARPYPISFQHLGWKFQFKILKFSSCRLRMICSLKPTAKLKLSLGFCEMVTSVLIWSALLFCSFSSSPFSMSLTY